MKSNFYTTSIEEALSPFITQVKTLISLRQLNSFRPLSQYSLCKACESVNFAVIKFISTAENVASNYQQISREMTNACKLSRTLVSKILECTMSPNFEIQTQYNSMGNITNGHNSKVNSFNSLDIRSNRIQYSHATFMQFNEGLMKSIERILLIADWITVLDIRRAIIKVIQSLNDMDSKGTDNFPVFMHMFSRFGTDMVELGELSGQRQLDLNNIQLRCLVAFVRSMLEKTTVMILAVWKVKFRHDSRISRTLRALVFQHTNHLLDLLMGFLVVSHPLYNELSRDFTSESSNHDVEFLEKQSQILFDKIFSKDTQYIWEILNMLKNVVLVPEPDNKDYINSEAKINSALPLVSELLSAGQTFTQCSFVCLSERQHIISLCRRLRVQLRSYLESSKEVNVKSTNSNARAFVDDLCDQIMTALFNITIKYGEEILANALLLPIELNSSRQQSTSIPCDTKKPIRPGMVANETPGDSKTMDQELQSLGGTADEPQQLSTVSKTNHPDVSVIKLKVINVCELLAHVSMSKEISLVCVLTQEILESLAHMINLSVQIGKEVPTSKHARDSTDVLLDVWIGIISDLANIKDDLTDWRKNKYSHQHYPFAKNGIKSSEIMDNYKLLHLENKLNDNHITLSLPPPPPSPANTYSTCNNTPKYPIPSSVARNMLQPTMSMNSSDKIKHPCFTMLSNRAESPNPWLSVPEIDRIISMKGRTVIGLASQITMFSHNEGPLKTSVDLVNCVQEFTKETAHFHSFLERNMISNRILPELDKLPVLISSLCSVQSIVANTRSEMIAKIDRCVELVRHSVTLITTLMINWKDDSMHTPQPSKHNRLQVNSQHYGRSNTITCNRNQFPVDDVLDNKSCFSDSTNTSTFQNSRHPLTRSSSMGRKLDNSNFQ